MSREYLLSSYEKLVRNVDNIMYRARKCRSLSKKTNLDFCTIARLLKSNTSVKNKIMNDINKLKNTVVASSYSREIKMKIYNDIHKGIKDEIYMKESGLHKLNAINKERFVNKQCLTPVKTLCDFILKNTTYVTFNTFMEKIRMIAKEISAIQNKRKSKLILVINELKMFKSNFWVSLLLRNELKKNRINYYDIIASMDYSIVDLLKDSNEHFLFIVPDDCSYSGRQLSSDLEIGKEYADKLKELKKYNNFDIYIAVPYISGYAKNVTFMNYITQEALSKYIFPKNLVEFKNFWEICVEKNFNPFVYDVLYKDPHEDNIQSFIYNFLSIYVGTTLIYFDHKLADGLSTIQCIYNYGLIFNKYKILDFERTHDERIAKTIQELDSIKKEIIRDFDDLIKKFSFSKLDRIIAAYRSRVLFKESDWGIYIPLMEKLTNMEIFTEIPSCYKPKLPDDFVQGEDYFPLTTCKYTKRDFRVCSPDLNEDADYYDLKDVCPLTFYKKLEYKVKGKTIKEIIGKDEDVLESSLNDVIKKINPF